jgi:hypothetical protein
MGGKLNRALDEHKFKLYKQPLKTVACEETGRIMKF